MSTYYEYQDVKVMIAHKLMSMDGWKVYGYHADESDPMTDYFDPAYWGGIAEKMGIFYVLMLTRQRSQKKSVNTTMILILSHMIIVLLKKSQSLSR